MCFLIYALLVIRQGCCTDDYIFGTKTVSVGQSVTLTCPREKTLSNVETFYWMRIVSGNQPEVLGATFTLDGDSTSKTPDITAKQEKQTFILHIKETKLNDTGLYFCIKVYALDMLFLKGEFLRIKGPEPDTIAVSQVSPSDPVHPGEQITLDCSVFSDSEKKTCPSNVYWFRAGSDESHPSLIYAHKNSSGDCNSSPETRSAQKCDYSFSKTVSSTDAGTYYCAVASCGHILFGNGAKLEIKASDMWDLQTANVILCLLCAALTTSLVVITFLVYTIKKKSCSCFNGN
ncbi:signal-regulatory protein beta-2-like isoform X2 [Cololabis saira]|uniref:signal-regulatory protein beta-2-like isoform X2 n=1 Tax=Cololabis saira TaxID=129043 RepID=UPI002AD4C569|nr:signal-regulatory protein beta-2-like isoform X2 [Cololabis saira]